MNINIAAAKKRKIPVKLSPLKTKNGEKNRRRSEDPRRL
jgi:hypothetical protein